MKRLILTVMTVMLVVTALSSTALAGPWSSRVWVRCDPSPYNPYRYGIQLPARLPGYWSSSVWNRCNPYGFGGSMYPSTNVNVRHNERWNTQGGESSYEQSPSLEGKLIDAGTLLTALLIITR